MPIPDRMRSAEQSWIQVDWHCSEVLDICWSGILDRVEISLFRDCLWTSFRPRKQSRRKKYVYQSVWSFVGLLSRLLIENWRQMPDSFCALRFFWFKPFERVGKKWFNRSDMLISVSLKTACSREWIAFLRNIARSIKSYPRAYQICEAHTDLPSILLIRLCSSFHQQILTEHLISMKI
jgi:hypothetical protein